MKKIVKKLLSELYSDDALLDCLDYINDECYNIDEYSLEDVIELLNYIKDNIIGEEYQALKNIIRILKYNN